MNVLVISDITPTVIHAKIWNNITILNNWADAILILTRFPNLWDSKKQTVIDLKENFTVLEMVNKILDLCETCSMVQNLVFCGDGFNNIILSNAIAANNLYPGLTVTIAKDAVKASSAKSAKRATKVLKALGIKILSTDKIVKGDD